MRQPAKESRWLAPAVVQVAEMVVLPPSMAAASRSADQLAGADLVVKVAEAVAANWSETG